MVIAVLMMDVESVVQLKTVLMNPVLDMVFLPDTHLPEEIKTMVEAMQDKVMDSLKDKPVKDSGLLHPLTAESLLDRFMISAMFSQSFTM